MINLREYLDAVGYGKYGLDEFKMVFNALMGEEEIGVYRVSPIQVRNLMKEDDLNVVCYRLKLLKTIESVCYNGGVSVESLLKSKLYDDFNFERWLTWGYNVVIGDRSMTDEVMTELQQETIICLKDFIFAENERYLAEPWDRIDVIFLLTKMLGYDPDDKELTKLLGISGKVELSPTKDTEMTVDLGVRCFKMGIEKDKS